jgi:hypothetical protein
MLCHLLFKRGEPGRVGRHVIAQQLVPRAHRRFVSRAMVRMARLQREHQPIEEATAVAGRADEQPIHRGRQPKTESHSLSEFTEAGAALIRTCRRSGASGCVPVPISTSPSLAATANPPPPPIRAISDRAAPRGRDLD